MSRIRSALGRLKGRAPVVSQPADISRLHAEIDELRAEIDELRVDSRRVAELYDLVFERLREQPKG
ncbi:DUF6752 domain-containing protein [Agromyces italicus]|uniref:DUF6752 domain-containing protein n=1 Tax=Agromyces italicus TaxID=279572 RepID=UPI0012F9996F|nr:DUF6752 domain-containing protein [Agromyces italicus]